MSVEAIVRVVAESAAAEADQIVENARSQAAQQVAAASSAAVARIEEACAAAEPGFRAEATRRVNAARLRLLERRAARSAALVAAASDGAETTLRRIAGQPDDPRWQAGLARLLRETAEAVGAGGVLAVRRADLAAARALATALSCAVTERELPPNGDLLEATGVVGRSADGRVEVDATLAVRLARARIRLAEPVAALLGVDE